MTWASDGTHPMSTPTAVVDYGIGNLRSVINALEKIGAEGELVPDGSKLGDFGRIILPGVGAFEEAMANLRKTGFVEPLNERVKAGTLILGICLGMQLMCRVSDEDGEHEGLGWFDAHVRPFPAGQGLKVPHMGWNTIRFAKEHPVLDGIDSGNDTYFVHSYYVDCADKGDVLGTTEHGLEFNSMIQRDNLIGMQFHPEKSQQVGLKLLENFVKL